MTTVPMNDLRRVYAASADDLDRAARETLRSGWWLNGPRNDAFCAAFADYLGVAHCIGVANGTDALEIALRALVEHNPRRDGEGAPEIVTVANAGGYATTAARLAGCVPVFADIERDSQLLSIPSAVAALTERTVAVVVTHLYGGLVDVPTLRQAMNAAGHADTPILEDCAQAHGLSGCGGMAGAFGTIATFSFYPTKNLGALGDGGAIATTSDALAETVRRLRQYGWIEKYRIGVPHGRNSRLDELQAAFLLALLPKLDSGNARRREILDAYQAATPNGVHVVRSLHGDVGHLAVVLTNDRDHLRAHMSERGVATDIHYPVLDCDQDGWRDQPSRIGPTGLDASRASVGRIATLPCFPAMTDDEVAIVCDALKSYAPQ